MSYVLQRRVIASSLVLLACADEPRSRESAPNRDADAPALSKPSPLPPCDWTLEACAEHIEWRMDTLLEANEVDADARFIAIGGQVVGVSSGAAELKSVARVHMTDEVNRFGDRFRRYIFPEKVATLIDVVDGFTEPGKATVFALACLKPKSDCSLWQVSAEMPDGSLLEPIADSTFDGVPTALLYDEVQEMPCVVAKSLYCFDGSWREELAPSSDDNHVRAVAMGNFTALAVAAQGEYWTRPGVPKGQSPMPWMRESVDADVTWTGASDIYTGYFLIGEQGAFMQKLPSSNTLCSHTEDFAASSGTVLVTKRGDVLFGLNEGRCLLQSLGSEEIASSTTVFCRASQNLFLMTEHTISGTLYCERL